MQEDKNGWGKQGVRFREDDTAAKRSPPGTRGERLAPPRGR